MTYGEVRKESKSGWENNTEKYWDDLLAFTRRVANEQSPEARDIARGIGKKVRSYDSLTELHYSPGSMETHRYWVAASDKDEAPKIKSVEVFYQNGSIDQIHGYVTFDRGQGTDVYLHGKALQDFLEMKEC